jgi:EAL domain-containing protein (putative c-di-GMP-specific phosphodiesterase class I)
LGGAGQPLQVAVNLSGRQLADEALPDRLATILEATAMPGWRLSLEVTETSLVEDVDGAAAVLGRLAALGVSVAIDDFGTGWASLSYLRQFPVHTLKIDRVFVDGLLAGGRDAAIVAAMVSLGRELGLTIVAEGIERAEQRDRLVELGCRFGQGFLYAPARPAEELDLRVDQPFAENRSRAER